MAYAQWLSVTICPKNFQTTVKNVALSWGKFYSNGDKDKEVPTSDIEGKTIDAKGSFAIYSCGRSDASSGTEGSFDLFDGDTKVGTYTWDCPWGRKENTSNWNDYGPPAPDNPYITQQNGANTDSGAIGNVTLTTIKA